MTRNLFWAVGGTLLLLVACGDGDDGGSGGSGGTTSTSGTGGGSGSCLGCGDYVGACITECPAGDPEQLVCSGSSWDMLNALNECICGASAGNCEAACPARCTGTGEDGTDCLTCQSTAVNNLCADQFNACLGDTQ